MAYRDEENALRARIAELEQDLHKALVRERELRVENGELDQTIDAMNDAAKPPTEVRWFTLLERAGRFFGEVWKVTAWGAAVCGMVLVFACVAARNEYDRGPAPSCPPPPEPTITPLGATCNNFCESLNMRQVSHWQWSGGDYRCTCTRPGHICQWTSTAGTVDCEVVP